MRIARVEVYGYDLTYVHGDYVMSGGRSISTLPSTLVRLLTDDGLEGWGETCPLGPAYLPAFGGGARAALAELGSHLPGLDPTSLGRVHEAMDAALMGHAYAKSAVDVACWDLLGRAAGLPVATLLGGRRRESFGLYVAIPLGPPEDMTAHVERLRAEGVHDFQLKLGADPYEDAARVAAVVEVTEPGDRVIADANGGWRLQDAVVAARLLDGLPRVYLEQPCATLAECVHVRRHTTLPMVLDEVIMDAPSLLAAHAAGGMEAINVKVGRVGGLTRARLLRDLCEQLGLRVTVEDSWGGDVVTAAVSQLAASTSAETLFTVSFMNDWTNEHVAGHQPRSRNGVGSAPVAAGLGIEVARDLLGEPLLVFGAEA
jgi:L-alanine-DL-glutamate epimerase-like enolase superfamily enzyme